MTPQRFDRCAQAARQMLGEIEWCTLPALTEAEDLGLRCTFASMLGDAAFAVRLRSSLEELLVTARRHAATISDRQEIEQQAAGLVQTAIKFALVDVWPETRELFSLPLITKFRRLPAAVQQAPSPAMVVPSMAEQRAGARPYFPRGGR